MYAKQSFENRNPIVTQVRAYIKSYKAMAPTNLNDESFIGGQIFLARTYLQLIRHGVSHPVLVQEDFLDSFPLIRTALGEADQIIKSQERTNYSGIRISINDLKEDFDCHSIDERVASMVLPVRLGIMSFRPDPVDIDAVVKAAQKLYTPYGTISFANYFRNQVRSSITSLAKRASDIVDHKVAMIFEYSGLGEKLCESASRANYLFRRQRVVSDEEWEAIKFKGELFNG